jgi:hypothetical protein
MAVASAKVQIAMALWSLQGKVSASLVWGMQLLHFSTDNTSVTGVFPILEASTELLRAIIEQLGFLSLFIGTVLSS